MKPDFLDNNFLSNERALSRDREIENKLRARLRHERDGGSYLG